MKIVQLEKFFQTRRWFHYFALQSKISRIVTDVANATREKKSMKKKNVAQKETKRKKKHKLQLQKSRIRM